MKRCKHGWFYMMNKNETSKYNVFEHLINWTDFNLNPINELITINDI